METGLLILGGALALLAAAVIFVLAVRSGRSEAGAGRHAAELAGQLTQMAGAQTAALGQISERLQGQERLLTQMLQERLEAVSRRVSDTLEKTAQAQASTLGELRERIARIDAAQANITELSSQMVTLQQILANKQARGSFGELQLEELVQSVLPPSAYSFQAQLGDGKRADCLLHLPNPPGPIAVDAKFPLESYRALAAAADEGGRQQAGRAFRAAMIKHVNDIAEKYIVPGETAEAALLFLPSEAVYAELHAHFEEVVQHSYRKRVFVVSPTTLWATLNTIRAVLKDVRMREQAGVIQQEVRALLEDVRRLDDRVGRLQQHFNQTTEDVRNIRISTEKVTKRGERIEQLEFEDADANALAEPGAPAARIGKAEGL